MITVRYYESEVFDAGHVLVLGGGQKSHPFVSNHIVIV